MNKTSDGRFVDKRVVIDKGLLKNIIYCIKIEKNINWKEFSKLLKISEQTIRHDWIHKNTIPLKKFKLLINLSKNYTFNSFKDKIKIKEPFWGQRLKEGVIKTKKVKIPDKNNEKFAEFYGILLGDGCVFSNLNGFAISADKILDKNYVTVYINKLIFDLFEVYPSFYFSKKHRSLNCFLYSRILARYLTDIGFPKGIKYPFDKISNQDLSLPFALNLQFAEAVKGDVTPTGVEPVLPG